MRARNWGNIGFLAAIGLSLFIIVTAGIKKSRSRSIGSKNFRTSSEMSATFQPTSQPSISLVPSSHPSDFPSSLPSAVPSLSTSPSSQPSLRPSISAAPSDQPSSFPSLSSMPSGLPSFSPSEIPSASPSLAPTGFFGSSTTILLDSGKSSATVALIFVIAFAYATLYMCGGTGNESDDDSAGSNSSSMINDEIKRRSGGQHERKSDCEESEILSRQQQSDDTIDTNDVYPTSCNVNGVGSRLREMNYKVSNYCTGASSTPIPSNHEANTKDIDVEEGRGVTRPTTSVIFSKFVSSPFKNSGVSPLKTPTVFKKRHQNNISEERFNRTRYNEDRNSSVFVRGNTPLTRSKLRSNKAEKRSLTDDRNKHIANPYSNQSPEELAAYSNDEESIIECSAYTGSKKECTTRQTTDLQYSTKGGGFQYSETITINSNESSLSNDDDCTLVHQSPINGFHDVEAEMEAYGIEVSSQYYDSDDDID